MELGDSTFGKIVCIEFCEAYSTLTFGIFFASSALYQVLNLANSQEIQARKNATHSWANLVKESDLHLRSQRPSYFHGFL